VGHLGGDDFLVMSQPAHAVALSEEIIERFDAMIPNFYDAEDRKRGFIASKAEDGRTAPIPIMNVSIVIIPNDNIELSEVSQISEIASRLKKNMEELPGSCYMKYRPKSYRTSIAEPKEDSVEVRFPGGAVRTLPDVPVGRVYEYFLSKSGRIELGLIISNILSPICNIISQSTIRRKCIGCRFVLSPCLTRGFIGDERECLTGTVLLNDALHVISGSTK